MTLFDKNGVANDTWRRDTDHFVGGYTAQLAAFVDCVREGGAPAVTGEDARAALAVALAAIMSVARKRPVTLADVEAG